MSSEPEFGPTEDTRDEIMSATYRVLCDRGYANLSMRAIAEEVGKSRSLLHYHYDSKDELLWAFLDRFLDRLDEYVADLNADDPYDRLMELVDRFVIEPDDDRRRSFYRALMELRLQAAHNEQFQRQLRRNSRAIRDAFAEIIEEGIEQGRFRDVDADLAAELVYDLLNGARMRQATLGEPDATVRARRNIESYVESGLLIESVTHD